MRILYLTGGFPFPLTSGYLRHYHLIERLAARHDVTLLSFTGARFQPEHAQALEELTREVQTFPTGTGAGSPLAKVARRVRASFVAGDALRAMGRAVRELSRREPFDVVISGKRTVGALKGIGATPVVADLCDASSARVRRSMEFARPLRRLALVPKLVSTGRRERSLARRAARTLVISSRDREDLALPSAISATIVPNGVDLEYWTRGGAALGRNTMVFTGAMDYRPNTDAALFLVREVLPAIRREVPEARLLVVGRDPTPELVQAGQQSSVTVTGFVDDLRPYLVDATVFAAPIRFGAGMQNKVLEALAMEMPVVSSALAADGLRTEGGEQPPIVVADDLPGMVRALVHRLRETDLSPVAEGRDYIARHYTWAASGRILEEVLEATVNET